MKLKKLCQVIFIPNQNTHFTHFLSHIRSNDVLKKSLIYYRQLFILIYCARARDGRPTSRLDAGVIYFSFFLFVLIRQNEVSFQILQTKVDRLGVAVDVAGLRKLANDQYCLRAVALIDFKLPIWPVTVEQNTICKKTEVLETSNSHVFRRPKPKNCLLLI